jgi:hypothetical protein
VAATAAEQATKAGAVSAEGSSNGPLVKASSAQRNRPRAAPVAPASVDTAGAKSRRLTHSATARTAPVSKPAAKKTIDQEFGF